jgi:O-antigen ligase
MPQIKGKPGSGNISGKILFLPGLMRFDLVTIGFVLLSISVFLMPFPRSWCLYPLGLSMVVGLILWITSFRELELKFVDRIRLNLPPILYFLIIMLYFLFGTPEWKYLEGYLMFLLVPVFCFPVFSSACFKANRGFFILSFVYGLVIICLFEFGRAIYLNTLHIDYRPDTTFDYDSNTSPFRSQLLSFMEHPTYLSMKAIFAICLLFVTRKETKTSSLFLGLQVALLLIYIYFLSSRTIFIALVILCLYFFYIILKKYRLHFLMLVVIPLFIYGTYLLFDLNPRFSGKLELIKDSFSKGEDELKRIEPRIILWETSIDVIKNHPVLGVGLKARDILADEYRNRGYSYFSEVRLNAHNQFLETQLTFGIPGSAALLLMLFAPLFFRKSFREPELYISFLIILVTVFIFESALVRMWGIMFYTVFYCFTVNTEPELESDQ